MAGTKGMVRVQEPSNETRQDQAADTPRRSREVRVQPTDSLPRLDARVPIVTIK